MNYTCLLDLRIFILRYTDIKEKKIFLIYKEILIGAFAKLFMRKGFLIYEKMRKYVPIYWGGRWSYDFETALWISL